jgi:hypothetical protein
MRTPLIQVDPSVLSWDAKDTILEHWNMTEVIAYFVHTLLIDFKAKHEN